MRNFMEMTRAQWARGKFVCVGLDPDIGKTPPFLQMSLRLQDRVIRRFCHDVVQATKDIAGFYKPNSAFFEGIGKEGEDVLSYVINLIHNEAPDVPVILDFKRADIGNTNRGYVESAFTWLKADAVTVNPYFGGEALQPFLEQTDRGTIILCRTSNPGAAEFQNLETKSEFGDIPLYQVVAHRVAKHWNRNRNCALVVGATAPTELTEVRKIVGNGFPILIPGIGVQGGNLNATVLAGKDINGQGVIINSSGGILYASTRGDFAEAARRETQKLHDEINKILKGTAT